MAARHFVFLVEEPSMEALLRALLPRLLPAETTFDVHTFHGKHDLRRNLLKRLRGYSRWASPNVRIVVLVDRDGDDCLVLKRELEEAAAAASLRTPATAKGREWQVANRIVVQELEAWFFGDWGAVRDAYPRVSESTPNQSRYRDPDAVSDTWQSFEGILKRHGYFSTGLRKIEAARAVAPHMRPERNRSHSFRVFRDLLLEAAA